MIRSHFILALAAVAGLGLSACGNSSDLRSGTMTEMMSNARGMIPGSRARAERLRPTPGFPGLDPALIAGQTVPIIGAYTEGTQALAGLYSIGISNGVQSWRTADNAGLSMTSSGVLVSSRGLGADLHAAEVQQTAALIAAGRAGTAQRRHAYLDGISRQQTVTLTCTVQPMGAETLVLNGRSLNTLRFDESCAGDGHSFVNRYWRDAGGPLIRQSSQWVSPAAGMLHVQRLIE